MASLNQREQAVIDHAEHVERVHRQQVRYVSPYERNTRVAVEAESYKAEMRQHYPGTAEQFEAAFPKLLEQWQMERAHRSRGHVRRAAGHGKVHIMPRAR